MTIPFNRPGPDDASVRKALMQAFSAVLDEGDYIMGKELLAFEQEYAAHNEVREVVGVGSGLDALQIALQTLDIGPGHEVIVPGNTYFATVLAVLKCGARPILVDPDPNTHLLSASAVESAITERTRALLPVHLYGTPCDMDSILAEAEKHGLDVIEDNAQAHGALFRGRPTGSMGRINATSFYPSKNLGALGDGGALTTNDPLLASKARSLRNYGSPERGRFDLLGSNSRLDEMQAAFLRITLPFLADRNKARRRIAENYREALLGIGDLSVPAITEGAEPVYHLFVLRTKQRDALQEHLHSKGIGTLIHYPIPPHLQPAYLRAVDNTRHPLPISAALAKEVLSIPMFPGLGEMEQDQVIEAVKSFWH